MNAPGTSNRRWVWIALIAGAALFFVCCSVFLVTVIGANYFTINRSEVIDVEPVPQEATVPAGPTLAPEATPLPGEATAIIETDPPETEPVETEIVSTVPAEAVGEPDYTFEGVSFAFPAGAVTGARGEVLEASTDPNLAPWERAPETIWIQLEGYPFEGTFHQPQIFVYPTEEFAQIDEGAAETIENLRQLLESPPAETPEHIPYLPMWNSAQMMRAQVEYLEFQNGRGVRFLTQYGQAAWPINNNDMFYTFQGLTDDGQYYISVILPIASLVLPPADEVEMNDEFFDTFPDYVAEIEQVLNDQPGDTFTPTLGSLDLMIQSLQVNR